MKRILHIILPTLLSVTATSQTFTSEVNQIVPDDGTVMTSPMVVTGLTNQINSAFGLVQVCINMDHTWDGDMDVRLKAPDGSVFQLFSGVGGDGDGFFDCCLRGDADEFIYNFGAPFNGTFLPMGNMGVVNNGQNPNNEWALILYDTYAFADQGYLYNWSISFDINPPAPFPFESTNLPIARIMTGGNYIPNEPKVEATLQLINHGYNEINHYYDTDFEFEGQIMVELQGFTGPYYPKKNYDFDLIDDEGLEIDTTLLGMPAENDWIFKAEYLDPTLMYNNIAYSFSRSMGRYAPRIIYCELFIDGEYQGVFSLTEKIKRSEERVNIAKLTPLDLAGDSLTGGYIIEMNHNGAPGAWDSQYPAINFDTNGLPVQFKNVYPRSTEIMPEQLDYIHAYVDSFEFALHNWNFADPEDGYRKWINEETFIDFMLVNEMSTNYDSYGRSTFMYKEKITDGGKLKIGPPWDYDRGFCCVENWVWEETHPGWPFPDWWDIFDNDTLYTNQAWCRWNSLREDLWSNDAFHNFIDSINGYIGEAAVRNFQRWSELGVTDYNQTVIDLKNRLDARLEWIDNNIIGNGPCIPSVENHSPHLEEFEGEIFPPDCWTLSDLDNDGLSWQGNQPVEGYESEHSCFSYSFMPNSPDNWIISPQLHPLNGEHLTWYVSATADDSNEEFYQVLLSTTDTDPNSFNVVLWEETVANDWWRYRAADLTAWENQDIYIAFRHLNSADNMMLRLDNIQYPSWTNEGVSCIVGIDERSSQSVSVYPNPFVDSFVVRYTGVDKIKEISMQDIFGHQLQVIINPDFSLGQFNLRSDKIASGMYILELRTEGGEAIQLPVTKQ